MRRVSYGFVLSATCVVGAARADLPSTAPIYGGESLDAIGARLEQSASAPGHNDSLRDEAERRLRANGDAESVALGGTATSIGATMLIGGLAFAGTANWSTQDCVACLPAVLLIGGGLQLTILGLIGIGDYGGLHHGRGHGRRLDALVHAMTKQSTEAAASARRARLTLAWTLLASGVAFAGGSIALFAMGHQSGFDDEAREGLAAASALAGGWLVTIASTELATRWTNEIAIAPTRGGAMLTYERRW
jgi:hypothetical protein